jgi:hypothetical protein
MRNCVSGAQIALFYNPMIIFNFRSVSKRINKPFLIIAILKRNYINRSRGEVSISDMTKKGKNNKKVGSNCGNNTKLIPEGNTLEMSEKQEMFIGSNIAEKAMACSDSDAENDSEADEEWEMKKIISIAAVKEQCPIKCSHDTCTLVAATIWVSNFKPTENWYSCLDCQV